MRLGYRLIGIFVFVCMLSTVAMAGTPAEFQSRTKDFDKPGSRDDQDPIKGALDCTGAIPVMLDATYSGDTTGGINQVSTYSCSFFDESGPEDIYVLELATEMMFTVDIVPLAGQDLDLAVLDQCDEDLGCLIVADTGVETLVPLSGTFYFVVDGYLGAEGPYELVFTSVAPPEPVDVCDILQQAVPGVEGEIVPSGSFAISGDTCGGANEVSSFPCGFYTENGFEDWWELTLLPGASIDVDVTHSADGALWLFDNCAEPFECIAYADDTLTGEAEVFSYMNTSAEAQLVVLAVDSFGTDTCGAYSGTVSVNPPGVIPVEEDTWGAVKARF